MEEDDKKQNFHSAFATFNGIDSIILVYWKTATANITSTGLCSHTERHRDEQKMQKHLTEAEVIEIFGDDDNDDGVHSVVADFFGWRLRIVFACFFMMTRIVCTRQSKCNKQNIDIDVALVCERDANRLSVVLNCYEFVCNIFDNYKNSRLK